MELDLEISLLLEQAEDDARATVSYINEFGTDLVTNIKIEDLLVSRRDMAKLAQEAKAILPEGTWEFIGIPSLNPMAYINYYAKSYDLDLTIRFFATPFVEYSQKEDIYIQRARARSSNYQGIFGKNVGIKNLGMVLAGIGIYKYPLTSY